MPVTIGSEIPKPPEENNQPPKPLIRVMISEEDPIVIPDNFDELPKEEQDRIMGRYRYMGIRLNSDLKDQTIPLTRQTLDLP